MRALTIFALLLLATGAQAEVPYPKLPDGRQRAFPSAEGFGAAAVGGRGGAVIAVTTLADAGPGSLRACLEASGPRTCIFRVSGTIELDSEIVVRHPFYTLAGQTAPGGGIQIKLRNSLKGPFYLAASEGIVRHIRCRPGPTIALSSTVNCFYIGSEASTVENVILDHVSAAWATDQLMSTLDPSRTQVRAISVQWSLFYEGLSRSTHVKTEHSKGPNLRACHLPGISFHHNLIADNTDRNPNITCAGQVNLINNVIYNGRAALTSIYDKRGNEDVNIIGNTFIQGPSALTKAKQPYGVDALQTYATGAVQRLYLLDNVGIGMPNGTYRPKPILGVLNPNDASLVVTAPLGEVPETVSSAAQAYNDVLARAGAFPRDSADTRALTEVVNRTGKIINHPNDVGGWPVLATGAPYADSDDDGMADDWENAHGLDPAAPDGNADRDGDGWTNLEEFLAELAGDTIPVTPPAPVP
jgi:hypothetical protein